MTDDKIIVPPVTLDSFSGAHQDAISEVARPPTITGGGAFIPAVKSGRGWRDGVFVGRDTQGRTNSEMQLGKDRIWNVPQVDQSGSSSTQVIASDGTLVNIVTDGVTPSSNYPDYLKVESTGISITITGTGVTVTDGSVTTNVAHNGLTYTGLTVDCTVDEYGFIADDGAGNTGTLTSSGLTVVGATVINTVNDSGVAVTDTVTTSTMDHTGYEFDGSGIDVIIGSNGVTVDDATTNTNVDEDGVTYTGTSSAAASLGVNGLTMTDGTYTLSIPFTDIDRDISIREIDVCDSGTPKKMLILASAPYTP